MSFFVFANNKGFIKKEGRNKERVRWTYDLRDAQDYKDVVSAGDAATEAGVYANYTILNNHQHNG